MFGGAESERLGGRMPPRYNGGIGPRDEPMQPFTFQTSPNILFETGAAGRIAEIVAGFGAKRVMLVTDGGVRGAGLTRDAERALAGAGLTLTVFEEVVADPPAAVVERAAAQARGEGAELVLAIGGGSALDTAKLVAYLAVNDEPLEALYGVGLAKGTRLPLVLVPTTAGTGSEVTPIAIVTTPSTEKKGVVAPRLLPDWAILDPELTLGLPPHVTAATGIDAMVHAIEAFTSRHKKNPISDQLARQALALLSGYIRTACQNGGDLEARSAMLLGSMLAGMAFANAPVAAVHALAYPIGALFHVPHGLSNALVLTGVMRFNLGAPEAEVAYAELAPILDPAAGGLKGAEAAARFVACLEAICRDCGVPRSLSDVGVSEADLPRLATDAMKQTRLLVNNPRELTRADAFAIYAEALDGIPRRAS
jgi:alcohol dehydrogenase class IV